MYTKVLIWNVFYSTQTLKIEPLVYKKYRVSYNQFVCEQQIWNNLKCKNITREYLQKLKYSQYALTKVFLKYNACHKSEVVNYLPKK